MLTPALSTNDILFMLSLAIGTAPYSFHGIQTSPFMGHQLIHACPSRCHSNASDVNYASSCAMSQPCLTFCILHAPHNGSEAFRCHAVSWEGLFFRAGCGCTMHFSISTAGTPAILPPFHQCAGTYAMAGNAT